jgi:hypothetical protein
MSLYIERLSQRMGERAHEARLRQSLEQLKNLVMFNPSGNVESTRADALAWAAQLKTLI